MAVPDSDIKLLCDVDCLGFCTEGELWHIVFSAAKRALKTLLYHRSLSHFSLPYVPRSFSLKSLDGL